jgi:hypothetical protein
MFFERPPSSSPSLTTRLYSRHQRAHVPPCGFAAIPFLFLSPSSLIFLVHADAPLFEFATHGMEARFRACPGEAEQVVALLVGRVLPMTPTVK